MSIAVEIVTPFEPDYITAQPLVITTRKPGADTRGTPCNLKLAEGKEMMIPVRATRVMCLFRFLNSKLVDALGTWKSRENVSVHRSQRKPGYGSAGSALTGEGVPSIGRGLFPGTLGITGLVRARSLESRFPIHAVLGFRLGS